MARGRRGGQSRKEALAVARGNLTPETFLEQVRICTAEKRKLEEQQGTYRAALKRAKGLGVDQGLMVQAMGLMRKDSDEVAMNFRNLNRYMTWMGRPIGAQGEMFGDADGQEPTDKAQEEFSAARAYDAGYHNGRDNEVREGNPHEAGSELFVQWDTGWVDGQEAMKRTAETMGENAKAARSDRKRRDPDQAQAGA